MLPKGTKSSFSVRTWRYTTWLLSLLVLACDPAPAPSSDELIPEPPEFAAILYPEDNPTTEAGLDLGKALFYDPILSADSTISCATCHRPELAFTDGLRVSRGIRGEPGKRNTLGLTNVGYLHRTMFWDGRADNLETQALHPIASPQEMGGDWPTAIAKLRKHPQYAPAFREVFPDQDISPLQVGRALAQFQRSLISSASKYDRVQRGEASYTPRESLGHAIFFDLSDDPDGPYALLPSGECAHCHPPPHFTDQGFTNNGLDEAFDLEDFKDPGRGGVTGTVYDNGKFRNPSLRNVALTAPYMHDGRFSTLEEVVDHYDSGGRYAENKSPNVAPLGLTADQRTALIAFLHTLTDSSFVSNPEYRPTQ